MQTENQHNVENPIDLYSLSIDELLSIASECQLEIVSDDSIIRRLSMQFFGNEGSICFVGNKILPIIAQRLKETLAGVEILRKKLKEFEDKEEWLSNLEQGLPI